MRRASVIVSVLIACVGLGASAHGFSLSEILSKAAYGTGFKLIHVKDLAAMRAQPDSKVMVFDANPTDVREEEGIIPGAHLLSSSGHYDVASTLPPDKSTPLVFYCHNTY
jgi:hypothetical protein